MAILFSGFGATMVPMSSVPLAHAAEAPRATAPAINSPGAALRHLVRLVEAGASAPIGELAERLAPAYALACAEDGLLPAAARQAAPDRYARHLLHADPQ